MKTLRTFFSSLLIVGLSGFSMPSFADDTELYTQGASVVSNASVRPNILLIMDNSGSMKEAMPALTEDQVNNAKLCLNDDEMTKAGSGTATRMMVLKAALCKMLDDVSNVNMGLERFTFDTTEGTNAPILYPVTNINTFVDKNIESYDISIKSSSDDAEQGNATEKVILKDKIIEATKRIGTDVLLEGTTTFLKINIAADGDDARESLGNKTADGSVVSTTKKDIALGATNADGEQLTGLRFANVQIPTGATVLASWIEFTAFNKDCQCNQAVSVKINGFDSTNADAFNETSKNISSRAVTAAQVDWNNIEPWVDQKIYSTPDLSEVIQSITTKSGWNSGQAIGFSFIRDPRYTSDTPDNATDSNRRFYSAGEATDTILAPVLKVFYSTKAGYSVGEAASFAKSFVPSTLKTVSQQITNTNNDAYEFLTAGSTSVKCKVGGVVNRASSGSGNVSLMALGAGRTNSTQYGSELLGFRFTNLAIPANAIIKTASLTFNFWDVSSSNSAIHLDSSTSSLKVNIFAENTTNAVDFSKGDLLQTGSNCSKVGNGISDNLNNLSKRMDKAAGGSGTTTDSGIEWDVREWGGNDSSTYNKEKLVATPNLSSLISPLVSSSNWKSGDNALVFLIKPDPSTTTSSRRIYDFSDSNGATRAAKLDITYALTEDATGAQGEVAAASQQVGLRFQGVNVPRGATIKTAFIKLTSGMTNSSTANLKIFGEKTGNSETFKEKTADISGRSKTTSSATWSSTGSGTSKLTGWETGQTYSTPELKTIVQEIVNQGTWCGGNSMSFFINENLTAKTSLRNIMSFDESPSSAPSLHVEFLPATIDLNNTCMQQTVSVGIKDALDDGVETTKRDGNPSEEVFLTGSNDDAILNMANTQKTTGTHTKRVIGVRFRGIPIKKGSIIKEAKLEFTGLGLGANETENMEPDESKTFTKDSIGKAASLKIQAEIGNSSPFTETNKNFTKRITTGSPSIDWQISSSDKWANYESYSSPPITSLVQAIVNSASWESNGDMAFFVSTNDDISLRKAVAFEKSSTLNTRLVISVEQPLDGGFKRPLKEYLKEEIRNMKPLGWTPTVDALFEAALYYRGDRVSAGATNRRARHDHRVSHPLSHTSPVAYSNASHYDNTVTPPEPKCIPGISAYPFSTVCSTEYLVDALTNPPISPPNPKGSTAKYRSPIENSLCQVNHIILLSDGEPTQNNVAGIVIGRGTSAKPSKTYNPPCGSSPAAGCKNYIDEIYDADDAGMATMTCAAGDKKFNYDGKDRGKCGPEVAKFLSENPQITGMPNSTVKTHTIGMKLDTSNGENFLKKIASEGKGGYYRGDSIEELLLAFRTIIATAMTDTASFASPATSVNVFNRLYHNNEIYFTFFKPSKKVAWEGNVKRYDLCTAKTGCASSIVGKGGTAAVGADGGILSSAQDVWSTLTEADGPKVTMAGAGGVLPAPDSRNIYTNTVGDTAIALTDAVNAVKTTNASLTASMLNVATEANSATVRTELINWIRGYEDASTNKLREWVFGDPLHSTPGVFTYGQDSVTKAPKTKVIVNTNEGAMRMLDGKTGVEDWMFIPKDMLAIQKDLRANAVEPQRKYGIDGRPVVWTRDNNYNGIIDGTDSVWVFTGMRRGGRNIYAMDVTPDTSNPPAHKPRLVWTIFGGQSTTQGDFSKLGQTWSTPVVTKVLYNGATKTVLMFAGGFDATTQDVTADYQKSATMGNTIYMVDPLDGGKLLWSAGNTNNSSASLKLTGMNYSFPSDLTVIDGDGDGLTDRLYVGDTGGQLWRIDLRDVGKGHSVGGRLAILGDSTTSAGKRRFFYAPDVARLTDVKYSPYAKDFDLVLIGSGHRPNPLDKTINDRLYAFRDRQTGWLVGDSNGGKSGNAVQDTPAFLDQTVAGGSAPASTKFFTITEDKLYDATDEVLKTTTDETKLDGENKKLQKSLGWKVDLVTLGEGGVKNFVGEKALAKPLVLNGIAYYTTFVPPQLKENTSQNLTVEDACKGTFDPGIAKAYAINILTGEGGLADKKRAEEIGGGIPAEPIAVFTENGITVYASTGSGDVNNPNSPPALKVIGPGGTLPRETVYWIEE